MIYPKSAPVKSPRTFGRGILRSVPHYHAPYGVTEAAWWAQESARLESERTLNRIMDREAGASRATDSMSGHPSYDDNAVVH